MHQERGFAPGDVAWNEILFYEVTGEVEVSLGGGGEADFNFFKADVDKGAKHPQLASDVHGLNERLVAVT